MDEWTAVKNASLEVICGCMFSGKTVELQRRLRRAEIAKLKVKVFKPLIDERYSKDQVVSHDRSALKAIAVEDPNDILRLNEDAQVIGIDEAQFFNDDLIHVCESLANSGKRVIISGLDLDSFGQPFGPMPILMSKAEFLTKLHAICTRCGNLAHYSYRKDNSKEQIALGAEEAYEALCRSCFNQASK